jgi:hypothetical protein
LPTATFSPDQPWITSSFSSAMSSFAIDSSGYANSCPVSLAVRACKIKIKGRAKMTEDAH